MQLSLSIMFFQISLQSSSRLSWDISQMLNTFSREMREQSEEKRYLQMKSTIKTEDSAGWEKLTGHPLDISTMLSSRGTVEHAGLFQPTLHSPQEPP